MSRTPRWRGPKKQRREPEAWLYRTDGTAERAVPRNGRDFGLSEVYELLGIDMVEVVGLNGGKIILLDEEGKLKDRPMVNGPATKLYHESWPLNADDRIVGDAIVCDASMFR